MSTTEITKQSNVKLNTPIPTQINGIIAGCVGGVGDNALVDIREGGGMGCWQQQLLYFLLVWDVTI